MSLVEDAAQVAELQATQNCGLDREPLQMMQSRVQILRFGYAPASIAAKHERRGVTR